MITYMMLLMLLLETIGCKIVANERKTQQE